jgi:hypothetical protein
LLRIVEHLPWHSAYKKALADDDEYAERYLAHQRLIERSARAAGKPVPPEPPISIVDWDPEREQTALLLDALAVLRSAVIAPHMKRGKSPKVQPAPRPETALRRAERRAQMETHKSIVAKVLRKKE